MNFWHTNKSHACAVQIGSATTDLAYTATNILEPMCTFNKDNAIFTTVNIVWIFFRMMINDQSMLRGSRWAVTLDLLQSKQVLWPLSYEASTDPQRITLWHALLVGDNLTRPVKSDWQDCCKYLKDPKELEDFSNWSWWSPGTKIFHSINIKIEELYISWVPTVPTTPLINTPSSILMGKLF